jgi:tripeptide aminopeptidase
LGEIQYETFNAANTEVVVKGRNIHPGSAKGKMKELDMIAMRVQRSAAFK